MSVGPTGMVGGVAGAPLAQTKGAETDRAQQETSNQARQTQSDQHAENAAGIGQTEQDEQASDRDADGRRPWELQAEQTGDQQAQDDDQQQTDRQSLSRDPSGESGSQLDVSG